MIIDFKEIPRANQGDGLQDTFELFARDFLRDIGYKIIQDPSRGADGKKDLILEETREGIAGKQTKIKWLVSCKHYAHSGKSINDEMELDIQDRLKAHECNAFMGFYSTISATSLTNKLHGQKDYEYEIFDREKIESYLFQTNKLKTLIQRYFFKSYEKYVKSLPKNTSIITEKKHQTAPTEIELINAAKTAVILIDIAKIYNEFFNDSDWVNRKKSLDKIFIYSDHSHSNQYVSDEVFQLLSQISHLTRGDMPSEIIVSVYSAVLAFFPSDYNNIQEYDIANGKTSCHIGFNIVYDALIYLDNFDIASWGLTILKHIYLTAKRQKKESLIEEVKGIYRELESTLERPERNDLEYAKELLKGFKNDLDNYGLSFPSLPIHIWNKMENDRN